MSGGPGSVDTNRSGCIDGCQSSIVIAATGHIAAASQTALADSSVRTIAKQNDHSSVILVEDRWSGQHHWSDEVHFSCRVRSSRMFSSDNRRC